MIKRPTVSALVTCALIPLVWSSSVTADSIPPDTLPDAPTTTESAPSDVPPDTNPADTTAAPDDSSVAETAPPTESTVPAHTEDYIILYRRGANVAAEAKDLNAKDTVTVEGVLTRVAPLVVAEMTPTDAAVVARDPDVARIEKNMDVAITGSQTSAPWNLDRIDQSSKPLDGKYTYPDSAGSGTKIYIVDTGVSSAHEDLAPRVVAGYTSFPSGGTADCHGHGTHVASTAAGTTWGVAKKATIVPVRVLGCTGEGSLWGVFLGLDWIARTHSGAGVVNMSLGVEGESEILANAVDNLVTKGLTVVVAAGNSNDDACNYSPAGVASAITVGAIDSNDRRASFSNYGSCVDIFAPGVNVTAASPGSTNAIATYRGTSMASPHVAGVAAVLLGLNPGLSPAQVTTALLSGATTNLVVDAGEGSPNRIVRSVVPTLPTAFAKTSPTANQIVSQSTITLTWQPSLNATGYDVCFYTLSGVSALKLRQMKRALTDPCTWTRVTGTTYLVSGIKDKATYTWQVRAVNDMGSVLSDNGSSWSFTTSFPKVTTRTLTKGSTGTRYSATLQASGGAPGYSWNVVGLPSGISVAGNTIGGVPTTAGTFSVTATLTDAQGATASATWNLVISQPAAKKAGRSVSRFSFAW